MNLESHVSKVANILSSEFQRVLLGAALANLDDQTNYLRLNNFAYSIRELSRHFLETLAPDVKVYSCTWFIVETENGKPTRAQRIKYAIQGGIDDNKLCNWGFDTEELNAHIKAIKKCIDSLSKYTHINSDTFNLPDKEVKERSEEALISFDLFVDMIQKYKEELSKFLEDTIDVHILESLVSVYLQNIDLIAPNYSINFSFIDNYEVIEITSREIIVKVHGTIDVTLEYGSTKERREGDGLDLKETFPFQTKIYYDIEDDFPGKNYEVADWEVDISSWYGSSETME
jgi:hypothetical protein